LRFSPGILYVCGFVTQAEWGRNWIVCFTIVSRSRDRCLGNTDWNHPDLELGLNVKQPRNIFLHPPVVVIRDDLKLGRHPICARICKLTALSFLISKVAKISTRLP
jgi:hypothetical protein